MQLAFGGSAREIGASFILLELSGKRFALDCGIRMAGSDPLPDLALSQSFGGVDCVILSHAHTDHSGALPVLMREYPNVPLYMTHATRDLARVLLYDSLKIMDRREAEIPLFAESHVEAMLERIVCRAPGSAFKPFDDRDDITVEFHLAGHVAGAVGVCITSPDGILFYSGDFSGSPQNTVDAASFPRMRPDVAIFESTYGNRMHADRASQEDALIDKIREVIDNGGKMLIPAFALGRAQEIMLIIRRALTRKALPSSLKVYADGMVDDITSVYSRYPAYLRAQHARRLRRGEDIFYSDNVIPVRRDQALREKIVTSPDPCVIIASSGMLSGGPSQMYASRLAANPKNFIAITGYQDEESPGRQLAGLSSAPKEERFITLDGKKTQVNCQVGSYSLSAHADKGQIISLAQSMGAGIVFLNHGEDETIEQLALELQNDYRGMVYVPKNGETFEFDLKSRRQPSHVPLVPMAEPSSDPAAIHAHLSRKYPVTRAFSIEDIAVAAGMAIEDPADETWQLDLRDSLIASGFFEADRRRPFMLHTREAIEIPATKKAGIYEVNEALKLAEQLFAKLGAYKRGAKTEEKAITLSFEFPAIQASLPETRQAIDYFVGETGWGIQTNKDVNLSAAEALLRSLLLEVAGSSYSFVKTPSYFRERGYFTLAVSPTLDPDQKDLFRKRFAALTGMSVDFADDISKSKASIPLAGTSKGRMEQNRLIELIDLAFSYLPHAPSKKSVKIIGGMQVMELTFTTKALGERYLDTVVDLEMQSGWKMAINPASNQHELLGAASAMLSGRGLAAKKISFIPETGEVRIACSPIDEGEIQAMRAEFAEKTGASLVFAF